MHLLLFVGGPTLGRSFSGTELAPFAVGRASRRTKRATRTKWRHAPTAFVGGPTPGRSFSGTELAPFAAGRASHRFWPLAEEPTTHWRTENSLPGKPSHFRP